MNPAADSVGFLVCRKYSRGYSFSDYADEAVAIDFQHNVLTSLVVNTVFHSKDKYYYNILEKYNFFSCFHSVRFSASTIIPEQSRSFFSE